MTINLPSTSRPTASSPFELLIENRFDTSIPIFRRAAILSSAVLHFTTTSLIGRLLFFDVLFPFSAIDISVPHTGRFVLILGIVDIF